MEIFLIALNIRKHQTSKVPVVIRNCDWLNAAAISDEGDTFFMADGLYLPWTMVGPEAIQ